MRFGKKITHNLNMNENTSSISWDHFVMQYPSAVCWPTSAFNQQEQFLLKSIMIPIQKNLEEPKVAKKDLERYLRFFDTKPQFEIFSELLDIPYFVGFVKVLQFLHLLSLLK